MFLFITQIINYVGLFITLWLGIYVVSRNPRRLLAWLTGLTLWSVAGMFLNVLLALDPPPPPAYSPGWLRVLLPFWTKDALGGPANLWLQGWSVTLAFAFWHHATVLMRPGYLTPWRWVRIIGGYVLVGVVVWMQIFTPYIFASVEGDPLYVSTLRAGEYYMVFFFLLLLYMTYSLVNLVRSARAAPLVMPRKQLYILATATLVATMSGPVAIGGSFLGGRIPTFVPSLMLGISVVLIGYGVSNFSALMVGRTIRRDFIYNAIAIGIVASLYSAVAWISVQVYAVAGSVFVFMVLLSIVTHSLVDIARTSLDRVFYRRETRQLRVDLQKFTRMAGDQSNGSDLMAMVVDSLCASVRATYGLVVLFDGPRIKLAAHYQWNRGKLPLEQKELYADDFLNLEPGHFPPPLADAALLMPLYADHAQLGALLMGCPENGISFSQTDIDMLLYPADQLAEGIRYRQQEARQLARAASFFEESTQVHFDASTQVSVKDVEDALRNLSNFSYLGDHPLAKLRLLRSQWGGGVVTHIDRGKAVYAMLNEAIEKLSPE
ncbi:MAG: hypothetical protein OEZ02_13835, partial [Anaerolineae bacterium]|nr:hypothetical protein [Anaerolineae bacterium]